MEAKGATMIDLNNNGTPAPKETGFPAGIYERLPRILSDGCQAFTEPTEKAVFLMAGLGVLSGLLPNVSGVYDGRTVNPHLYVYTVAPYGSGKGGAMFARELGLLIHKDKTESTKTAKSQYYQHLETYKIELKAWKKQKSGEPPARPQEPGQKLHFIPANNSKTGFFELLSQNDGAGAMFETEGDTLADAIRQDYGNFSDGLRKGFHHEPISFYRRLNREFIEIESPRISVVLSSTFDQLLTLIPTAENGLFSRFLFYELPPNPVFKNVFEPHKENQLEFFKELAANVSQVYYTLQNNPEPYIFRFTDQQKIEFLDYFQRLKAEIQKNITTDLDGTVNRLGLQFFRIAMIFTTLRNIIEPGELDQVFYCRDTDFQLTKELIEILKAQAIKIYLQLPEPHKNNNKHLDKAELVCQAIDLHQAGATYSTISQAIFGSETHKSTVYRWINE